MLAYLIKASCMANQPNTAVFDAAQSRGLSERRSRRRRAPGEWIPIVRRSELEKALCLLTTRTAVVSSQNLRSLKFDELEKELLDMHI